ncbi:MAG: right-handed parallel beta-helix repeat-containing protein [Gammaproteobacteria bacterium]|nr:right-handed parallel beta-helix repeat-containing protein [Gammaproteobacteria bacterium]
MNNSLKKLFQKLVYLSLISSCLLIQSTYAENYYVHPDGDDSANGNTESTAFKSLDRINQLTLAAGDNVYLSAGATFAGTLKLADVSGNESQPITITSYGSSSQRAIIDGKNELAGIEVKNSSYLNISNIEIQADGGDKKSHRGTPMRVGVLVYVQEIYGQQLGHITLDNLKVHDIYHYGAGEIDRGSDVNTNNGTQAYGWGIRVYNRFNGDITKLIDITIKNTEIYDVAHTGIKINSSTANHSKHIKAVTLTDNYLHDIGGPGIQFSGVDGSYVANNDINRTGSSSDDRKWGRGSGMWTWGTNDVLIEHNEFKNAEGPADSAGFHIDFNCTNIIAQYNFSMNNEGGFVEILGNNENNSYRYNVSINDGRRIKGSTDNPYGKASHDGKILWFSGYVGRNNDQIAPVNNYIYNNTIYVSEHVAQLATHNETNGAVIANNIFYFKKGSVVLPGDRYHLVNGENPTKDIFMKNNLFLQVDDWPANHLIQDTAPVIGNAEFVNEGGLTIADYIPSNITLIDHKGIEIKKLPNDVYGLSSSFNADKVTGLAVSEDIMGNSITDLPPIGALVPEESIGNPPTTPTPTTLNSSSNGGGSSTMFMIIMLLGLLKFWQLPGSK